MRTVLISAIVAMFFSTNAQQTERKSSLVWARGLNNLHAIIENKGQTKNIGKKEIIYGYYKEKEKFFFTKEGIIIQIDTFDVPKGLVSAYFKLLGEEKELYERAKTKSYYLFAEWQNANPDIQIIPSEKTEGYFTFREHQELCFGYKKLTYKNVYPNIDIEYTLPTDSAGIKYNIILHPGADLSQVELLYSGDIREMLMDNKGNIVIKTPVRPITEHAPKTYFYSSKKEIGSAFILNNKTIRFFTENYDARLKVVIDPWVAATQDPGEDMAYDVDYDFDKNLYAYSRTNGGGLYVTKYSPTGTILWTHLVTTESTYDGNFLVDRLANKLYISEGFRANGARAYRINTNNGVADGFMSQALSNFREMWDMVFDCNNNRIIGLGGGTNSNLNGGIINTTTGQAQISNFTGYGGISQDVVNGVVDNQGRLFVLYSTGNAATQDRFSLVNNTFNGNIWMTFHGMYSFQECSNHPLWEDTGCGAQNSNAFNAMDVNDSYLYMYDGRRLRAYNKANGASIAATSVGFAGVWYQPIQQGGIAVDDCNNIYVGGNNKNVLQYSFNGSTFTGPTNIPVGWPGSFVWDIKYDRNSNLLFISGYEGVAVVYASASASCINNSLTDSIFCTGPSQGGATITVHTTLTNPTINYTWYNSGGNIISQTNGSTSLTNTVNNLPNGTYIVRVQINPLCGPFLTDTITIDCPNCGGTVTPTMVSCFGGNNGSATVTPTDGTPPFTFLWNNGSNNQTISNLTAGNYTVTLTDATSCTSVITTTITQPAALQSNITKTDVTCYGGNNGIATINTTGGTPPYYVIWSNGQTDPTAINLSVGNYTATVTDANGCTTSSSITINQPPQIIITASASPTEVCTGNPSVLTADGAISYSWSEGIGNGNNITVNPTQTTTYTVTGTDANGCTAVAQATVTVLSVPTSTFTVSNIPCFGNNTIVQYTGNASSNATFAWNWSGGTAWPGTGIGPHQVSWTTSGTFQISLTVTENGCTSTQTTVNVNNPTELTLSTNTINVLCYGESSGSINLTVSGGTPPYTFIWNTGATTEDLSNIPAGIYSVTATDANSCTKTLGATITQPAALITSITPNQHICFGQPAYLTITTIGGTPPYQYYWDGQPSTQSIAVYPNITTSYTASVVDANGCTSPIMNTTVFVAPPINVTLLANTYNVCPGDPVMLTPIITGGVGPPYVIHNQAGNVVTPPIYIHPNVSGWYSVMVEDVCGTWDTSSVYINVYPLPPINILADTLQGCVPFTVHFIETSPDSGQTYQWNFGDQTNLSLSKNPIHTYTTPGTYDVSITVTSAQGCKRTLTINDMIKVWPKPNAAFTYSPEVITEIKPIVQFTNLSTGASWYQWMFGDGDSSSLQNPEHKYSNVGNYEVLLVAVSNKGCTDTARAIIKILEHYTFYAPTAFSPDGDRNNDFFYVVAHGIKEEGFYLEIYNRWGEIIWKTDKFYKELERSEKWDGRVNNKNIVPNGTYTWRCVFRDNYDKLHEEVGAVNVIR